MDNSRDGDLRLLSERMNNRALTPLIRYKAERTRSKIIDKLKDEKVRSMRDMLIKALRDGNIEEVDKISLRIREYEYRKYGNDLGRN